MIFRALWATSGFAALALGVVGIVTPVLPTVPFLLLAGFCFARSSDRLHDWLLAHPVFGPPILDWRRSGAISRRIKFISTFSMIGLLLLSPLLGFQTWIIATQALILCAVAVFIWSRPEA